MIYLFDKDEQLIKIVRKTAVKTALQKYELKEGYVSDRLTVELKNILNDELEAVEFMGIQSIEDTHDFHLFWVAQKSMVDNITTIVGVQSGIEELRKTVVIDKRPHNLGGREVINDLLTGTNWRARFVGETIPRSTNFYYISTFEALKKVCSVWGLEMQFFVEMNGNKIGARYIDFKQRTGAAVGKRVVYGHNALEILQEVERTNIYTALVGRGRGEQVSSAGDIGKDEKIQESDGFGRKITFENVEWSVAKGNPVNKPLGQLYVEIPEMTARYGIKNADGSRRPKIGFVDFQDDTDEEVVLEKTYQTLIDVSRPQVMFKTSTVYLKGAHIGDVIRVVRHDKHLDYEVRIFEITFNRLDDSSNDIKLGDNLKASSNDGNTRIQAIADKAIDEFVANEFSNFVQNLPDYLPSADGFNNNWYGAEDPSKKYPGKVLINDIWYKPDPEHEGHKIMLRWTGEVWEEVLRTADSERVKREINQQFDDFNESYLAEQAKQDEAVKEVLAKANTAENLADEAKRVGDQAKLDAANALSSAQAAKNEAIEEAQRLDTIERQSTETKLATAKSQAIEEAQRLDTIERQSTETKLSTAKSQAIEEASRLIDGAKGELSERLLSAETEITKTNDEIKTLAKKSELDTVNNRLSSTESSVTHMSDKIETEINRIEGKIPTEIGGRNYILGSQTQKVYSNNNILYPITSEIKTENEKSFIRAKRIEVEKRPDTFSIYTSISGLSEDVKLLEKGIVSFKARASHNLRFKTMIAAIKNNGTTENGDNREITISQNWQTFSFSIPLGSDISFIRANPMTVLTDISAFVEDFYLDLCDWKLETGNIATDWSPAPEDLESEITAVKTTITQTAEGVKQLSTKVTETDSKISTAETKINQLVGEVSSKVSQTEYDNLSGRVTSQQTAIEQNASEINKRLTSTQVEQLVNNKRFATSATMQQLVRETAGSFEREISETVAKIPTSVGGRNLLLNSDFEKVKKGYSFIVDGQTINQTAENWVTFNPGMANATTSYHAYVADYAGRKNAVIYNESNGSRNWKAIQQSLNDRMPQTTNNFILSADVFVTGAGTKLFGGFYYADKTGSYNFYSGRFQFDTATFEVGKWQRVNVAVPFEKDKADFTKSILFYIYAYNFTTNAILAIDDVQLETGKIPSDHTLAPEDLTEDIESVKTTINQTARGQEQLSTQLTQAQGKITKAETQINQLIGEVSSKVSQTVFDRLNNTVSSQATTLSQQANQILLKADKSYVDTVNKLVSQNSASLSMLSDAIEARVLKSDFDTVTGRVTSAETTIKAIAGQIDTKLSKTDADKIVTNAITQFEQGTIQRISEVESKIPTSIGGRNLWIKKDSTGASTIEQLPQNHITGQTECYRLENGAGLIFNIEPEFSSRLYGKVTFTAWVKYENVVQGANAWNVFNCFKHVLYRKNSNTGATSKADYMTLKSFTGTSDWQKITVTYDYGQNTNYDQLKTQLYFIVERATSGTAWVTGIKVETGTIATDYSLAIEDATLDTQKFHEIQDTVDSHTRTISEQGKSISQVVQTAQGLVSRVDNVQSGISTVQSQLSGSWAVKNLTSAGTVLNQINLMANGTNRIDGRLTHITGSTLIDRAVIKDANIASVSASKMTTGTLDAGKVNVINLNANKIVGLDANFIKSKIGLAIIDWMRGKTISAQNDAMKIDLNGGQILHYTDQAAMKRILSGYPTQFVKFATGTVSGKGLAGVTVIGSNRNGTESSNDGGFVGIRAWNGANIDTIDVVGDTVRLASSAFDSADGWDVITLPNKLEIDAHNVNHRVSSRVKVGDVWLWKNSSTYSSLRDTINSIIDNLNLLHNNKTTERGYRYSIPAKV
ncbi:phage tail spike protein [Streptococcus pluranimalium]|uniref:phage tail spike protein n=1 Tax=Streptococcus pluranimalium TaxID=82348 RepID=UPI0039FBDCDD